MTNFSFYSHGFTLWFQEFIIYWSTFYSICCDTRIWFCQQHFCRCSVVCCITEVRRIQFWNILCTKRVCWKYPSPPPPPHPLLALQSLRNPLANSLTLFLSTKDLILDLILDCFPLLFSFLYANSRGLARLCKLYSTTASSAVARLLRYRRNFRFLDVTTGYFQDPKNRTRRLRSRRLWTLRRSRIQTRF